MQQHIFPNLVKDQLICSPLRTATVEQAARLKSERGIGSIPVREGITLEGIFTVRDVAKRVLSQVLDVDTELAGMMSRDPETIDATKSHSVGFSGCTTAVFGICRCQGWIGHRRCIAA